MMRESTHGRQGGALLPSALRGGADEDADVFAVEAARLPLLAGLVPEGFPLGGEVTVAGGDPEEEGVVFFELVRGDEGDGAGLARCVHLREDFFGEGLFDSVSIAQLSGVFGAQGERESSVFSLKSMLLEICTCGLTDRHPLCLRRLQCRLSRLRQSLQCGRTWNTG